MKGQFSRTIHSWTYAGHEVTSRKSSTTAWSHFSSTRRRRSGKCSEPIRPLRASVVIPEPVERVILSIEIDDETRNANGKHRATRQLSGYRRHRIRSRGIRRIGGSSRSTKNVRSGFSAETRPRSATDSLMMAKPMHPPSVSSPRWLMHFLDTVVMCSYTVNASSTTRPPW